jgi:two-component system chemotaxis response regulator CheB
MNRIRVLVVDDSKFARLAIRKALSSCEDMEVVGEARDGKEAVRLALELKPDIITMDIVMPHMDGLTAIREILSRTSVPIIVVSEHTTEGAKTTIEALRLGAVDFVAKGSEGLKFSLSKVSEELISKIRLHAGKKVEAPRRVFKTGGLEEKRN